MGGEYCWCGLAGGAPTWQMTHADSVRRAEAQQEQDVLIAIQHYRS